MFRSLISLLIIILIVMCLNCHNFALSDENNKIIIGSKTFTEQYLLSKMLIFLLRSHGYTVEEKDNLRTHVIRNALINKKIDVYWEYTGTGYSAHLRQEDRNIATNAEEVYRKVKELDKKNGIIWLTKASLNNTYALVIKKETSQKYSIKKISDIKNALNQKNRLLFAVSKPFYYRPDGFKQLIKHYDLTIPKSLLIIVRGSFHNSVEQGSMAIAEAYATDAQVKQHGLILLEDDRNFFPVYNPAPVILEETLKKYPIIAEIAKTLAPLLDNETMIGLNYLVDIDYKSIDEVAITWLKQKGLLQ